MPHYDREVSEIFARMRRKDFLPKPLEVTRDRKLLTVLQEDFAVSRIFYPGCWSDNGSLENVFPRQIIFYMDVDKGLTRIQKMQGRHLVVGDMQHSPFPDGIFDAVFYQDAHVGMRELRGSLRALKVGGVFIYSTDDCGNTDGVQPIDVLKMPELAMLPIHSESYIPFRKL